MRDPNRIKDYCDDLATIWNLVPDWRLSQLMMNAIHSYTKEKGYEPFYTEDDDFLEYLFDYVVKITKKENQIMKCQKYKKFSDGWFTYYVNIETGEKKWKLEPEDIEVIE